MVKHRVKMETFLSATEASSFFTVIGGKTFNGE